MITAEYLTAVKKEDLAEIAGCLTPADLRQLVDWLNEKDDDLRYRAFLVLQRRSQTHPDVLPFWDELAARLDSPNSYQRSLGAMLLAENARWDAAGRFAALADRYLALIDDEKPVTVRQCIQGLTKIVPHKPELSQAVAARLMSIDLSLRKETQRKILLLDILSVLSLIRRQRPDPTIDHYFQTALACGLLDAKARKAVAALP